MSDDYTPTTDGVRGRIIQRGAGWGFYSLEEFDRWLADHDAQKRAEWEAEQRIAVTDDMVAEALDAKATMSQTHCYLYATEKCRCGEEWTDAHWMRIILERALSRDATKGGESHGA